MLWPDYSDYYTMELYFMDHISKQWKWWVFQTYLASSQKGRHIDEMTLKVLSTSVIPTLFSRSSLFQGGFPILHSNRQFPCLYDCSISCMALSHSTCTLFIYSSIYTSFIQHIFSLCFSPFWI